MIRFFIFERIVISILGDRLLLKEILDSMEGLDLGFDAPLENSNLHILVLVVGF